MTEWQRFVALCMKLAKTMSPSGDLLGTSDKDRDRIIREARLLMGEQRRTRKGERR